jgi:hypothetical protein
VPAANSDTCPRPATGHCARVPRGPHLGQPVARRAADARPGATPQNPQLSPCFGTTDMGCSSNACGWTQLEALVAHAGADSPVKTGPQQRSTTVDYWGVATFHRGELTRVSCRERAPRRRGWGVRLPRTRDDRLRQVHRQVRRARKSLSSARHLKLIDHKVNHNNG